MAIAHAQSWSGAAAGVSSLGVAVTGFGATDVCVVSTVLFNNVSTAIGTPTDDVGNTYTPRTAVVWDATFRQIAGAATTVTATGPATVTGRTSAGSADMRIAVSRITGANTTTPYDTGNTNKQTTTTPVSGAITTGQANTLVIAAGSHDGADTTLSEDSGGGWSLAIEVESNAIACINVPYKVFSSIQTGLTHTWTLGASRDWSSTIISLNAAGGGSTVAFAATPAGAATVTAALADTIAFAGSPAGQAAIATALADTIAFTAAAVGAGAATAVVALQIAYQAVINGTATVVATEALANLVFAAVANGTATVVLNLDSPAGDITVVVDEKLAVWIATVHS